MARRPTRVTLTGRHVRIVPVDPAAHADALYAGSHGPGHEALWRYLFTGPYPGAVAFREYLEERAAAEDPVATTTH
jgi:hypothetical protein